MNIKTMLEEMTSDLKALRFTFPVECRIEDGPDYLKATYRMGQLYLISISVRPDYSPKDGTIGLSVNVGTAAHVLTVTEARLINDATNQILGLAGFFEIQLRNRTFEA